MEEHSTIELIADAVAKHADRPALCINDTIYTYSDLAAAANGIRQVLSGTEFQGETRIGVITGDDFLTYASLLAIMSSGKAYVPLNRMSPPARNCAVIEQAGLKFALSSQSVDEPTTASAISGDIQIIETGTITSEPGRLQVPNISADDLAYLFFTSGSTGVPKGVPIKHQHLNSFMKSVLYECDYPLSAEDRILQMFELTFDLSVMSIFVPWCLGACCYVVPAGGISYMNILDILDRHKITVALMVPSVLAYMQRFLEEVSFPELRVSLFCGEALYHDLVSAWSAAVPNAIIENVYGPTEATIFCLRYPWEKSRSSEESVNGIVPIGKSMPRIRAYVVDEDGTECEPGQKGELCLAGDQVMEAYWNDPTKTEQAFLSLPTDEGSEHAYRTGDIAYSNANGDFVYLGRLDSQVKIDGHRIELAEIEHFARKFVQNAMAAAIVSNDELGRPAIALYLQKGKYAVDDVESYLRTVLPGYMQPHKIHLVEEMPLNLNGKIDRTKLVSISA